MEITITTNILLRIKIAQTTTSLTLWRSFLDNARKCFIASQRVELKT